MRSCRRNGRSCQNSISEGTTRKPDQCGGRGTVPMPNLQTLTMAQADGIVSQLPGVSVDWSGLSYQETLLGHQAYFLFALSMSLVFLVLAAQYESWSDPIAIILTVPMALLGALGAQWIRGLQNDVFCQVGLVMLVGLASKNAILIVEFAEQLRERGLPLVEAAVGCFAHTPAGLTRKRHTLTAHCKPPTANFLKSRYPRRPLMRHTEYLTPPQPFRATPRW